MSLILGLAFWFTKYVVGRGGLGGLGVGTRQAGMKTLAALSLGRDQRVILVQAGQRYLLLGVTAGQINTLAEFTPEQAQQWLSEQTQQRDTAHAPGFAQALQRVVQEKMRR